MDLVLSAARPALSAADAVQIGASWFGVAAVSARDLGSERDRTFALLGADERPLAVLKVSNPSEDPAVLDMEAAAALHISAVDPGLRVPVPWRPSARGRPGPGGPGAEPAALRVLWDDAAGPCWVRAYEVLPGRSRIDAAAVPDAAVTAWGETAARLAQALRSFTHPGARRVMPWDVQHALTARAMLDDIDDAESRAMVAEVLDRFEQVAVPLWPRLRSQVLHTDLTVDNTLTDEAGRITAIVDFGDMSHTALVADLASVLDSLGTGRPPGDLLRIARLVLDGYQRRIPLEQVELDVVGIAWAARSAITIAISCWRAAQGLEEREFAARYNAECMVMLRAMAAVGFDELPRRLGSPGGIRPIGPPASTERAGLAARRAAVFGPTMEALFYDVPIAVEHAEGVWITASDGRVYLDAYNNVPCIGHGHPRVTTAIARQSARINTHMRYLHPAAIELAERLVALTPPELDTVMLVNSGSEANDLAWRLATAATGRRGALCSAFAYHGITEATAALSPESWPEGDHPEHVETWEPPDPYRDAHLDGAEFAAALGRLAARNVAPAAVIFDGLLTSDGIVDLPPDHVQDIVGQARAAGALWIADEVQSGHGRTGEAMWCFERFGAVPDFVTLGKPMGNGHPVAALITRREIVASLDDHATLFSTFGGNPVSAVAALAVLDVLEDERVLDRVRHAGAALRAALEELAGEHPETIGDVRGVGLACGVELIADRATRAPDGGRARAVKDRMRHHGVLVGTTGRRGNVLKIRPPLAFTAAQAPVLAAALERALADTTAG